MTKPRLSIEKIKVLAGFLSIINQSSSTFAPWVMSDEQLEILAEIVGSQNVIVLKGRQVGSSTVCLLYALVSAMTNPGMPHAIVADTAEKATVMLNRIKDWCGQIGVGTEKANDSTIILKNGAVIDAMSAVSRAEGGESRVGRSKSYFFILASELAFWVNDEAVFRGLTATALPNARIVIESTASAADNLFRKHWNGDEWDHVFLSVEQHEAYRTHEEAIDDETWTELQDPRFGFTRRDSAAWWWRTCQTKFAGDEVGCLREFPVLPEHCFANAKGRWINEYVEAHPTAEGEWSEGRFAGWMRYKLGPPTEPVVFGVDTAAGHGGDSSALCVLGLHTGTIYATWCSSTTPIPGFIDVVRDAADLWKPKAIVVEYNGIGIPTYETLSQMTKHNVIKQVSGTEKHLRLQRLKQVIEDGTVAIGPELVYEVKSSRIQPPKTAKSQAEYVGRDDMLNALSFAREYYLDIEPASIDVDLLKKLNQEKFVHHSFIAPRKKRRTY